MTWDEDSSASTVWRFVSGQKSCYFPRVLGISDPFMGVLASLFSCCHVFSPFYLPYPIPARLLGTFSADVSQRRFQWRNYCSCSFEYTSRYRSPVFQAEVGSYRGAQCFRTPTKWVLVNDGPSPSILPFLHEPPESSRYQKGAPWSRLKDHTKNLPAKVAAFEGISSCTLCIFACMQAHALGL